MEYVSPMNYAQYLSLLGLGQTARKSASDDIVSRAVSGCIKELLENLPVQNPHAGP